MRLLCPILLLSLLVGCTPEAYKASADRQVQAILRDREKSTLDYVPDVDAKTTVPTTPSEEAYSKVPTTPVPPPTTSPVERAEVEVPYGPLGPVQTLPSGTRGPRTDTFGVEAAEAFAEEQLRLGPPSPNHAPLRFDLFQALRYAVENSRTYQDQMEELYLAALDVTLERHLFSPRPFVTQAFTFQGEGENVNYRSALTAATNAGVRQQLPYGGEVVASALVQFVDAIRGNAEEGESAALVLQGSIPLLRGAGLVNLEPLIQSERALVYQVREFEDFRRDFAVTIASEYFRLLTLQQLVKNRQSNYETLSALTLQTQDLFVAGKIKFLEVQRSLQAQLSTENSLIVAQSQYQAAVDDFKISLGMPVDDELVIVPVELELRIPQIERSQIVDIARRYRLDLRTAEDQIEDAQRGVQVAKNGLQADVDLIARGEIGNPIGTPARRLNDDNLDYLAGVTIDLPVDRLAERNTYRRSLIDLQRSQRSYELLRDRIAADVRSSYRNIRLAEISLQIQQRSIELAERRLEFSNELLKQGEVTARDVVESQTSLLDALDDYQQAQSTLQIEILRFLQQTGTLRVDPDAGTIGQVLDRSTPRQSRPDEAAQANPTSQPIVR